MNNFKKLYKMTCEEAQLLIVPMWAKDTSVTEQEKNEFQAHITTCPDCVTTIEEYQRNAADLVGNENFLRIAFIEIPPYGKSIANTNSECIVGKLGNIKEWFITTPAVVLLENSMVRNSWEEKAPDFKTILQNWQKSKKSRFLVSTKHYSKTLERG